MTEQPEPVNMPTADAVKQAVERLRAWVQETAGSHGLADLDMLVAALADAEREVESELKVSGLVMLKLAAAEARLAEMREALQTLVDEHDDCEGAPEYSAGLPHARKLLAAPLDLSALQELQERVALEAFRYVAECRRTKPYNSADAAAVVARVNGQKP